MSVDKKTQAPLYDKSKKDWLLWTNTWVLMLSFVIITVEIRVEIFHFQPQKFNPT